MSEATYQREHAVRTFIAELSQATHEFKDGDGDRAPNYVLLPSGGQANRVMIAGTVTNIEDAAENDDTTFWRANVNDGTDEMSVFAGQYQPDAQSKLRELHEEDSIPPAYLMVVGKPDVYEDDEDGAIVSIKAEQLRVIDGDERAIWISQALRHTKRRFDEQHDGLSPETIYNNPTAWFDDELLESLAESLA